MRIHGIKLLAFVLCAAAILPSCTANQQYRHNAQEDSLKDGVGVAPSHGVSVNVIELDEHGEFWDRKQLQFALGSIFEHRAHDGEIVITFVHGWKNNASPENARTGNLRHFVDTLNRLAERERVLHGPNSRHIVGIYLAWRGSSIPAPLLKEVSFYSRLNAATRIANSPAATEALLYILGMAHDDPTGRTRSIVVGHSMGGLLVEKALSQALVETAVTQGIFPNKDSGSTHRIKQVPFPADLVVLVNVAGPALYARELTAALEAAHYQAGDLNAPFVCKGRSSRKPVIVSVTSVGDSATGFWFPFGERISSMFQRFDNPKTNDDDPPALRGKTSQRDYYTHTEGHVKEMLTHTVTHSSLKGNICKKEGQACPCTDLPCSATPGRICYIYGSSRFILTPTVNLPTIDPLVPYWIMQIPRSIVRDHTSIFEDSFVDMLAGLLDVTNATSDNNEDAR